MKTLSCIYGADEELLESGSVSPDGETIVRFDVLERDEDDILDSVIKVTGIDF